MQSEKTDRMEELLADAEAQRLKWEQEKLEEISQAKSISLGELRLLEENSTSELLKSSYLKRGGGIILNGNTQHNHHLER